MGISRIGAKAVMLLCQKTDLILFRSDSGKYAPELAGRKSTPPISSGSESASGVTTRFAPSDLNSSESRSPTSSETLSAAVATAIPSESAAAVSSLRRGRRVKLSAISRKNIFVSTFAVRRLDAALPFDRQPLHLSGSVCSVPRWHASFFFLLRHFLKSLGQRRQIQHNFPAIHAERHTHRIAPARFADGRNINRRSTVPANHILPILAVAFRSANSASV